MRYAVFTDIHANLEALEAVLAKIDEIAEKEPIDGIWFLGDLVGYGPNPNECILKLRERTDVIIAGNHDWAAVGKIDLEDFSAAARISAEWTAEQLTPEHRDFLAKLPERLDMEEVTLVHGSPFGPLWEYLTSEVLAERSFLYFSNHYCFVGHTHVPVIFQQPDTIANTPTLPLVDSEQNILSPTQSNGVENHTLEDDDEAEEKVKVHPSVPQSMLTAQTVQDAASAYKDPESGLTVSEGEANAIIESHLATSGTAHTIKDEISGIADTEVADIATYEDISPESEDQVPTDTDNAMPVTTAEDEEMAASSEAEKAAAKDTPAAEEPAALTGGTTSTEEEITTLMETVSVEKEIPLDEELPLEKEVSVGSEAEDYSGYKKEENEDEDETDEMTPEPVINSAEERLNSEIEELLALLGLSQSMIQVTNEMLTPPEGHWEAPRGYRAIINPGGVGQPRDGDPRAAFMIYDTERGFEFYRIPYSFEKTQEKIMQAGLPHYLAVRLAYGR
jgi:diadenosine tetraphosphatase ApaH/serine/threonine PP2A family protein phosphatase